MILVDTSVWIDHLRAGDKTLFRLLDTALVLSHPFVHGELALGNLRQCEKRRAHEHRLAVINHRSLGAYIAIA